MKCFAIAAVARIDQPTLKYIIVGSVLMVYVKIRDTLEAKAKI